MFYRKSLGIVTVSSGGRALFGSAAMLALAVGIWPYSAESQDGVVQPTRDEVLSRQNREITLATGPLRLTSDISGVLKRMTLAEGPSAIIMELQAPLTPEKRSEFEEAGAVVEEYLGGTTYLFAVSEGQSGALMETLLRDVAGAAPLPPEAKIMPGAREPIQNLEELPEEAEGFEPSLAVQFLKVVGPERAREVLEELGFEVLEQLSPQSFAVRAEPDQAGRIAEMPSVKSVDRGPLPFLPLNSTGRRNSETDQAQRFSLGGPAPVYGGVTGDSVRIAVADSGVDENHDDFDNVTAGGGAGTSRVYNMRSGSGSHGTHVASIVGGSGLNSGSNAHPAFGLRGHAPGAMIGDYGSMGSTYADYHAAIVNDDTDISNHSYVQSFDGYGTAAERIDEIVRGDATHDGDTIPARPQVWAAGNNGEGAQYGDEEGYYALFTSAKNTISVGSTDSRDNRVSDFSSLGPTFDGRIKPDVMAPGCNDSIGETGILAADNGTQGYEEKCGTSMAAPVVSGILGLMAEAHAEAGSPGGDLYPSTYKATLVQTARDMVKTAAFNDREFDNPDLEGPILYHAGPDFATGYGLVDADAAVRTITDSRYWRQAIVGGTGEVDTYCIDVPEGAGEVRATLAWDDEPGSTVTSITNSKLVNDLDLELVAPDGTVIRPWTLDPLPVTSNPGDGGQDPISESDLTPAHRNTDRRNTVEMAHVPLPEAGEWKVRVRAFNLPNATSQPYSTVASESIKPICDRGPEIVVPICERFPWVCRDDRDFIPRVPIEPVDWRRSVPVDDICKYVIDCPGCERVSPGALCPGWIMHMDGLPKEARVTVFDGSGRIIGGGMGPNPLITIDQRQPGQERFLVITGREGEPFERQLNPKIDAERIER